MTTPSIRSLLKTAGNPGIFFAFQESDNHPFYRHEVVGIIAWNILGRSKTYERMGIGFAAMSYGQTRDFINAVADEIGER